MKNKKIIKSFSIKGLFGTTDVNIPFDENVKILIGENGMGKTQVLNILNYTLNQRFEKLAEYNFESVFLEFESGKKVKINRQNIRYSDTVINKIIERIGVQKFLNMKKKKNDINISYIQHLSDSLSLPIESILKALQGGEIEDTSELLSSTLNQYKVILTEQLSNFQILYFPTYRKIEQDLQNLGYDEDDERLINFGMTDVENRFNKLTKQIQSLSTEGLANISGEILSQLAEEGIPKIDKTMLNNIDKKDIDIIFARAGNKISTEQKERIKTIVKTGNIQAKDEFLLYFLQKLIHIYDKQREIDNSIKDFRDVCNKYLYNKTLIYDESKIEIYIQLNDNSQTRLPLAKLSLGERQIISIFSEIYLSPPDCNFIVLFDEPELSLSIFWQRNLLPDIYNSGKCPFLFAVTHSPFVFENYLDKYAVALSQYLTPSNLVLA
jgi:predicted ATP-dependent endonuclease of OLD family